MVKLTPEKIAAASRGRVDAARDLSPGDFNIWKHYEERADRLTERLWSVGIWLMTIIGSTLSLPFIAGFVKPLLSYPHIQIENRGAVAIVAVFGILFCIYAYTALRDLREHIEGNWRRAGYVLENTWQSKWEGRKNHGWVLLIIVGALALVGFTAMFLLALSGAWQA